MPVSVDQMSRQIRLSAPARRIVSLVPSQTELLAALELEEEVIGLTKFCVRPERWYRSKTRVGGTKQLHLETIRALQPDLILANKEENDQAQLEALMQDFPVWISDIVDLGGALEMIRAVGELTGKTAAAGAMAIAIAGGFERLQAELRQAAQTGKVPSWGKKVAYFIWKEPWMVAGKQTFIDAMLQQCGWVNGFGALPRYPVIDPGDPARNGCSLVLLSSEPYPFAEKHATLLRSLNPGSQCVLVDGEAFSWYGSRLLQAPDYFRQLLITQ